MKTFTVNTSLPDEQGELAAATISLCENKARGRKYQISVARVLHKLKSLWEKLWVSYRDRVFPEVGVAYPTCLRHIGPKVEVATIHPDYDTLGSEVFTSLSVNIGARAAVHRD
jgi:hypothetical protein